MSQWFLLLPSTGYKCATYRLQDTEFPGVVARPIGSFKTSSDYHYQTMRCNVDLLKIIQVGLTLADEDGNYPQDISTWQFNFRFSVKYA
jgi:CCR4-NOT transcription complex subunit 7/8